MTGSIVPGMAALSPIDRTQVLLTEREVADALRVSPRTVRRWAAAGTLPAIEVGGVRRYRADFIRALLEPTSLAPAGNRGDGKSPGCGDGYGSG